MKAEYVVLGPADRPHSIEMTGPDGVDFVFDSKGIRRRDGES